MTEYLVRAKLEFKFAFENRGTRKHLRSPDSLPIWIGDFKLDQSPNIEFYLDELGLIEPDATRQEHTDYPVSLLYVERRLQVADKDNPRAKADEAFESLECLLRLFQQPGGISVRRNHYMPRVEGQELKDTIFFGGPPIKPVTATLYKRPPYPLDDDVLSKFIQFFNEYWAVLQNDPPAYPTTGLTRFNSSYERRNLADRLLDLVIAMEALFGDGKSGGIAHKVATQCACSLHPPEKERLGVIDLIKKSYVERNKIVHGGQREQRSKEPVQLLISEAEVDKLEDIVRKSLIKFLSDRS